MHKPLMWVVSGENKRRMSWSPSRLHNHNAIREAELQATTFTITSKLPYTLQDKAYGITSCGSQEKLKMVHYLITRARTRAARRATEMANTNLNNKAASTNVTQPTPDPKPPPKQLAEEQAPGLPAGLIYTRVAGGSAMSI